MAEKRTTYQVKDYGEAGQVFISDEAVASVAALAATEVDGVASLAGNVTYDLVGKLGAKGLAKGIKFTIEDSSVDIELDLNIEYGRNIPATCKKVQEKVKSSLENMTGLGVKSVNIRIAGISQTAPADSKK